MRDDEPAPSENARDLSLGGFVNPLLIFGASIALSFLAWGLVSALYFWPALRGIPSPERFRPILLLHSFRFVGLAFLVPGVVAPTLSPEFARPAAYGDLITCLLALATLGLLKTRAAPVLLWIFTLWGTGDLLYAFYQGLIRGLLQPGDLGAAFFIPTALVPLLLITHGLVLRMLLARRQPGEPSRLARGV